MEKDGLTLVDAGNSWNLPALLASIQLLAQPLKKIVITHAHPDHAGAAAALAQHTSATVFAHRQDIPYLEGQANMADLAGTWLCRLVLRSAAAAGLLNPPKLANVQAIEDGDTVGKLKVLHTPGHTPGSLSLWVESHQALICGDNISNISKLHLGLSLFTLDVPQRNQSLHRYEEYPAQILLLGHGPAYFSNSAVKDLLALPPPGARASRPL